ncbi:MAG: thioredoxin family protein [Verrucomicrobia bacterium]|nr:thioredoxin family protein [Verrucomicrobiota bacterium]MBS0645064.1 thioredoxin family protein [Verrucomicrobiota bacterium]
MRTWFFGFLLLPVYLGATLFHQDYDQAVQQARLQQVPLLLFFNGSDWSGLSMKMKKEILQTPEFEQGIGSSFICVEVDFPQHCSLTIEQSEKNQRVQEKFGIDQFPSLLLVSNQERVMVKLGYYPESGAAFASDLVRLCALDKKLSEDLARLETLSIDELWLAYDAAQQLQQQEAMRKILAVGAQSEQPNFFLVEQYRQFVMEKGYPSAACAEIKHRLFHLDPNNQQGHLYHLALMDFQALASASPANSPECVIRPLCDYLEQFGSHDPEHSWRIEMMIAQFYLDKDCWDCALKHAQVAYEHAPEEKREDLNRMLHYLQDQSAHIAQN